MEAIEVRLVIYGDESSTKEYGLSITIGPGSEQVIEELRSTLLKWAVSWLRLGQAVKLEEK